MGGGGGGCDRIDYKSENISSSKKEGNPSELNIRPEGDSEFERISKGYRLFGGGFAGLIKKLIKGSDGSR